MARRKDPSCTARTTPRPTPHAPRIRDASCPRRRSQHKQPYSDQPRFRWTLNRCTATAYSGFPGAQAQRSCAFAPGNPGLDPPNLVSAVSMFNTVGIPILQNLEKMPLLPPRAPRGGVTRKRRSSSGVFATPFSAASLAKLMFELVIIRACCHFFHMVHDMLQDGKLDLAQRRHVRFEFSASWREAITLAWFPAETFSCSLFQLWLAC